ncbi:unnamed protein product, partial [Discosporangium mesarthrocarpum]
KEDIGARAQRSVGGRNKKQQVPGKAGKKKLAAKAGKAKASDFDFAMHPLERRFEGAADNPTMLEGILAEAEGQPDLARLRKKVKKALKAVQAKVG